AGGVPVGTGQIGVPCNVLARGTVESETPGRGRRSPAANASYGKRFDMVARSTEALLVVRLSYESFEFLPYISSPDVQVTRTCGGGAGLLFAVGPRATRDNGAR